MNRNLPAATNLRPVLEFKGVTKRFGGITACRDISFTLGEGCIMGLIGPDGAGKTTALDLICGVHGPTEGTILFNGQAIHGKRPDQIVRLGISRTSRTIRLFQHLSVLENVCVAVDCREASMLGPARLRPRNGRPREQAIREQAMEFLAAVGLEDQAPARADAMPCSLQRRLEIARALALEPSLLLLDEPAAGMTPEEALELAGLIRDLHRQFRLTTLLTGHPADVVLSLCERTCVMDSGRRTPPGPELQETPTAALSPLFPRN